MKNDSSLRQHLLHLLNGDGAHLNMEAAFKDMPASLQGKKPSGAAHSAWELIEHMRITQWDILEFIRNSRHVSPEFPAGYWPGASVPADANAWKKSADAFLADLNSFCDLVKNETVDLFAPIPHAKDKTILREVLLAADHNSYHLGQLVLLRRVLGAWQ